MQVVGDPNLEANITWPILVINSTLGPDVELNSNCDYISIANRYLPETVKCVDAGTDVISTASATSSLRISPIA